MNLFASSSTSDISFYVQSSQILPFRMNYAFKSKVKIEAGLLRLQLVPGSTANINAVRVGFLGTSEGLVAVDETGWVGIWFIDSLSSSEGTQFPDILLRH